MTEAQKSQLNWGPAPVEGGTREQAEENMMRFAIDVSERTVEAKLLRWDEAGNLRGTVRYTGPAPEPVDGRWIYQLSVDSKPITVGMPGLGLQQVRFLDPRYQDIRDYPPVSVDGLMLAWKYAVQACWKRAQ